MENFKPKLVLGSVYEFGRSIVAELAKVRIFGIAPRILVNSATEDQFVNTP